MTIFTKIKKLISYAVVGTTLFGVVSATGPNVLADGPVFNRLAGDREMTVGRTQSQDSYSDPVSATTADKVTVAVYVHNGGNAMARNAKVRMQPLTSGVQTQHKIRTFLSADNAATVTDTVINGQVVGSPDMTINLNEGAELQYAPGSTLWFPDVNQPGIRMPDGIMDQGVNLGDVDFCWEHVGYVLADFTFRPQVQNPDLQTDKWVALFGGNNQWVKENTANMGDELRYQVLFRNNGTGNALNTKIVDTLDAGLTYQPNSVSKRVKDAQGNDIDIIIPDSQLIISGQTITIPLGTLEPGAGKGGFVYLRAKVNQGLAVGMHVLKNREDLRADNVPTVSSQAQTTVTVTPTPVPDVKILKEVVNVTQGGTRWVRENTAKPGDRLQYRLTVYNQGTGPAQNISVKDTLPTHVSYVAGSTKIYTTDPASGQPLPDGITTGGVTVGTIQNGVPDGNRYITFDVTISSDLPAGNIDLINTGIVLMNGVEKDRSTAKTTVTAETGLLLSKEVWNATSGQWVTRMDGLKPGDTVTYRILVRNTGNTTVNHPVIKDTLDPLLTYVAGSSRMDGSVQIPDEWITTGAGALIANVTPGNFKFLTFNARIGACPPGGTTTITNTATVTADGIAQKTATAVVTATAGPPPPPR